MGSNGVSSLVAAGFIVLQIAAPNFSLADPLYLQCEGPAVVGNRMEFVVRGVKPGMPCELLSSQSLTYTNCRCEAFALGTPNQDWLSLAADLGDRTNTLLFFRARTWLPTNGQIFVTLADTNRPFTPIINGQPVTLTPFAGVVAAVDPPIHSLNFGYDMNDQGSESIPTLSPQAVASVSGITPSMDSLTNFCASQTPISCLDLHGLTALADIECFNCQRLTTANIANCPNLKRICFEQCAIQGQLDLTGDTNLADIRGAVNLYTNIVFGGAGAHISHFCVRDNPQLQQLCLTNLFSLQQWFMWNCHQTGAITRVSMPSTKLTDVEIADNLFDYGDFSGEPELLILNAPNNLFTNVLINDCRMLTNINLQGNRLESDQLDQILTNLAAMVENGGTLDLQNNLGCPSQAGYDAATSLQTRTDPAKRWTVYLDYPAPVDAGGDGTLGGSNSVTFVTFGRAGVSSVAMHLEANGPAEIVWHWANGAVTLDPNNPVVEFNDSVPMFHTNYVTVNPPEAVVWFGKPEGFPSQNIQAIFNLSNFPKLSTVYLYRDSLRELSLDGCSSLRQIHLVGNPAPSTVIDQWIIDLDAATGTNRVANADFYFPNRRTAASDAAADRLIQKGYLLYAY